MHTLTVSVLMDLTPDRRYHAATLAALSHASEQVATRVEVRVVPTDTIRDVDQLAAPGSAVVVGPGSPYRDPEAVHGVIRAARERGVPLVGT
jgi:CTP synthase (UTP-ammonia lyase)